MAFTCSNASATAKTTKSIRHQRNDDGVIHAQETRDQCTYQINSKGGPRSSNSGEHSSQQADGYQSHKVGGYTQGHMDVSNISNKGKCIV